MTLNEMQRSLVSKMIEASSVIAECGRRGSGGTIAMDLVKVQPMVYPPNMLWYVDVIYSKPEPVFNSFADAFKHIKNEN